MDLLGGKERTHKRGEQEGGLRPAFFLRFCEAEGGGYRAKNVDSPGGQVVAAPKYCIFIVHVPLVNEGIDYETW